MFLEQYGLATVLVASGVKRAQHVINGMDQDTAHAAATPLSPG